LHIKRIDKWLNNINAWILAAFTCNHDLKFIITSGKYNKYLNLLYYRLHNKNINLDYAHVFSFTKVVQKNLQLLKIQICLTRLIKVNV
jgi:hypothetical protein